jgi:hypothetical protein
MSEVRKIIEEALGQVSLKRKVQEALGTTLTRINPVPHPNSFFDPEPPLPDVVEELAGVTDPYVRQRNKTMKAVHKAWIEVQKVEDRAREQFIRNHGFGSQLPEILDRYKDYEEMDAIQMALPFYADDAEPVE